MEKNPGFKHLKKAFEKFAAKHSADDITVRLIRSAGAGSKATVDQAMQEFPKKFVNQTAKDIYSLLTSQEVADGISIEVRSFDEAKIKSMIDSAVDAMKDRDTMLKFVRQIKQSIDRVPGGDLTTQLEGLASLIPGGNMIGPFIGILIKPIINDIQNGNEDDAVDQIMALADQIPGDMLAEKAANFTQQVTPERVSKGMHGIVGKLPSPKAVADILHGVGEAASKNMERVTKITSAAEVPAILKDLTQDAANAIRNTAANDKAAKKTFTNKKSGSFDL